MLRDTRVSTPLLLFIWNTQVAWVTYHNYLLACYPLSFEVIHDLCETSSATNWYRIPRFRLNDWVVYEFWCMFRISIDFSKWNLATFRTLVFKHTCKHVAMSQKSTKFDQMLRDKPWSKRGLSRFMAAHRDIHVNISPTRQYIPH